MKQHAPTLIIFGILAFAVLACPWLHDWWDKNHRKENGVVMSLEAYRLRHMSEHYHGGHAS